MLRLLLPLESLVERGLAPEGIQSGVHERERQGPGAIRADQDSQAAKAVLGQHQPIEMKPGGAVLVERRDEEAKRLWTARRRDAERTVELLTKIGEETGVLKANRK